MAVTPPVYEFPTLSDEYAEGSSYYSGTSVFEYVDDDDTWDQSPKPDDQTTRTTILERLAVIEENLNL
jgi:hypothetical protein